MAQEWANRSTKGSTSSTPRTCHWTRRNSKRCGVAAAQGDLLAFCDADDVVHPGWLSAHVSALAEADVSAGVFDYWSFERATQALTGDVRSPARPGPSLAFSSQPLEVATSQSGGAPFEDIGGFTQDLMTGEDMDLSWRLRNSPAIALSLNAEAVHRPA